MKSAVTNNAEDRLWMPANTSYLIRPLILYRKKLKIYYMLIEIVNKSCEMNE